MSTKKIIWNWPDVHSFVENMIELQVRIQKQTLILIEQMNNFNEKKEEKYEIQFKI